MTHQINDAQITGKTEQHLEYLTDRIAVHIDMVNAYNALANAAKADGIVLEIASGFRSFDRQLLLWNNKYSGRTAIKNIEGHVLDSSLLSPVELIKSILLYSALPGASRHHWGCDIDIYAPNLLTKDYQLQLEPWEYDEGGPLARLSIWLTKHAHLFGFYFPYATYQGGIAREPWHLSFAPLAQQYQRRANINILTRTIQNNSILGQTCIIENLADISTCFINNVSKVPENVSHY